MEWSVFPAVDPIPLPAPVWLFVALHTLTLALHFFAVHFLVGGLAVASVWGFWGRRKQDKVLVEGCREITARLPVVMTYVINLGVPPLLFSQVLYGRALYTSTVLIGAWWISVIALLMISYSLLYLMGRHGGVNRATAWLGLLALVVVLKIGVIYTNNFTLMLRPDLWVEIYRANPRGTTFGTEDPTVMPRWLFAMLGSIGVCGLAMMALSLKRSLPEGVGPLLVRWGGRLLAVFTIVQIGLAAWVMKSQPAAVQAGFSEVLFYRGCGWLWLGTALLLVAAGVLMSLRKELPVALFCAAGLLSLVNVLLLVLVRDGIRYVALKLAGFNIWERAVATNWSTVILFLLLFVLALGMMVWLISVVARMKAPHEHYV